VKTRIVRPKTAAERKARIAKILAGLDEMYPAATCALHHSNAWELLVATILSAQCTDKRVNEVTPGLFRKYPTIRDFAAASQDEMAQDIRSTGFFNNKAKSVIGAARKILADYKGEVPREMEALLSVPGAARKRSAGNCIRPRLRSGGGYARTTHLATPGPNQGNRASENREGSDASDSEGEVDFVLASDHSPRPRVVCGAEPEVRRMQAGTAVLRER
jgi:hypothetical protein